MSVGLSKQTEAVKKYCHKHLSHERYQHMQRVYETMQELNQKQGLGLTEDHLALTSWGHDIARELPGEVSALLVEQAGWELQDWELEYKLFCHNKAGILILQKCFGVDNQDIFQAVEHHTLGNSGLCPLAKLLYIADFLDPKRPFLKKEERQSYMNMNFDNIVYEVCRRTAEFLQTNQKPLLPPTLAMLQELEKNLAIAPSRCLTQAS